MRRLTAPPPHRRRSQVFKLSFSLNTEEEFLAFVAAYSAARGIAITPTVVAAPVAAPVAAAEPEPEPKPKAKPGPKPKAEVKAPEPVAEVEAPEPVAETAPPADAPTEITVATLTEMAVKKSTTHMSSIRAILSRHGVRKLIELNEADYPAVYEALKALGGSAA